VHAFSQRLAHLVVRRPRAVLLAAATVALAAAPAVLRLRLDTDPLDLLPQRVEEAATFRRFSHLFVDEQLLLVLVEGDDPARLAAFADRYAEALRRRPDVAEVRERLSGATAALLRDHLPDLLDDAERAALAERLRPEALRAQARRLRGLLQAPGGSSLAPVLAADPLQFLPVVGERLQAGLPVDPRSGYFRSGDGKALLLFVRPRSSPSDIEADRALLAGAARAATDLGARVDDAGTASAEAGGGIRVGFTGAYAYWVTYRDWLHRDTQVSTLLSGTAVLLFFALLLGAVRALPIVAVPLVVGLWLTAAIAGGLFGRVNAISLSFGTILLSIGIDLPIQIYNRLREELHAFSPLDALERTVARLAAPAVLATLGPTAVFLCCLLSHYRGLAELGLLAGLGLVLNLLAMMTVLPSLLAVIPARLWTPRAARRAPLDGPRSKTGGDEPGTLAFAALGRMAARRPRLLLAVVAAATALLAPAALRVRFERRLISLEPPSMPPARVKRAVERLFGGPEQLLVVLSDGADRDRALEKADRWRARAEALRRQGLLGGYESLASLFPSPSEIARRRAALARLDLPRAAAEQRAALVDAGFADPEPYARFLDELAHPPPPLALEDARAGELSFLVRAHFKEAGGRAWITTFLYPAQGRAAEALSAVRALAAQAPGDGVPTGEPVLEEALRRVVERDTVRVTAASVVAVALLLFACYRRVRPALAVLLPLGVAWILFAATLGAAHLPLNLFNLLAVPLVVGYGIDDHVFLVHRHEEDPSAGPARALASTGRAIVVTSLSTMAGFAALAAARFDGLRLLGVTGALAVALCLLAAFAVLPALLVLLYPARKNLSNVR
jgi:predicted RND superfamily exporter protein